MNNKKNSKKTAVKNTNPLPISSDETVHGEDQTLAEESNDMSRISDNECITTGTSDSTSTESCLFTNNRAKRRRKYNTKPVEILEDRSSINDELNSEAAQVVEQHRGKAMIDDKNSHLMLLKYMGHFCDVTEP